MEEQDLDKLEADIKEAQERYDRAKKRYEKLRSIRPSGTEHSANTPKRSIASFKSDLWR